MQYIWMCAYLYIYAIILDDLMCLLNILAINEVVGISRVHNNDNPILDSLLTNRKHEFVKVCFARPFFGLITHESCDSLYGFEFGRLVAG